MEEQMNPCCDKEFQDDSCASGPLHSEGDQKAGMNQVWNGTRLLFRNMGKVEALVSGAQKLEAGQGMGQITCCFYV